MLKVLPIALGKKKNMKEEFKNIILWLGNYWKVSKFWLNKCWATIRQLGEARAHMIALFAVCSFLALGLWFQPSRFSKTPAYANLLTLFPQYIWANLYAIVAILLAALIVFYDKPLLGAITFTATITLLLVWWSVFIVRWITDAGTTDVNVISWGVFLYLAMRAAWLTARHVDLPIET